MELHELRDDMAARIELMRADIERMEAAVRELDGEIRTAPPRTRLVNRARTSAPSTEARPVIPAGKLIDVLSGSQSTSTSELVRETGGDSQQLLTLLKELENDGQLAREGNRRSTRWRLITDEDRVAARAAELAARG